MNKNIKSELQVNTYQKDYQYYDLVTALSNGKFVVTWYGDQQEGLHNQICGQIFTESGAKSGSEFQVHTYKEDSQRYYSVAALSNGKFIVTWYSSKKEG